MLCLHQAADGRRHDLNVANNQHVSQNAVIFVTMS